MNNLLESLQRSLLIEKVFPKEELSRRNYQGYYVATELVDGSDYGMSPYEVKSAYNPSGDYIGNPKDARFLCIKKGIAPELATPDNSVRRMRNGMGGRIELFLDSRLESRR